MFLVQLQCTLECLNNKQNWNQMLEIKELKHFISFGFLASDVIITNQWCNQLHHNEDFQSLTTRTPYFSTLFSEYS